MLPQPNEGSRYLSRSEVELRRKAMDADVWLFIKWICRHGEDDIARFHRPLAYMLAGDAVRLAASLDAYDSEIVTQIKADLVRRNIDWRARKGLVALHGLLRRVNDRISRSMGKTTIGLDVLLWLGSVNPNLNIGLASKSDPAAWSMCETIGNIVRSDEYQKFYPDRLFPKAPDTYITQKWIRLNGRTNPNQESIEARGINAQWYSTHYHVIYGDDLASTEAKQGEATVADALRFLASLHGISMSERWGGTRYIFNGTIQGPRDDHAALASNPDYLTIRVPIWKKSVPSNLSNVMVDGVPVLPELYPLEDIKQKRADTIANDHLGFVSWLQNFELTAHEAGAMQFTAEQLRRSKFLWINRPITPDHSIRVIRRYLWNADGTPKIDLHRKPIVEPCRCYLACDNQQHAFVEFDPLTLARVLGVDQALSLKGDKWSIAVVAQDPFGFKYALKGASGRGYRAMISAIPYIFNRWGGNANPPRKVGIESNAWQALTADWIQRDESFRFLARRIEKVSPANTQKELRIFNNVLANLEMGTLLLDPDDVDRDKEMLEYSAAAEDPEDNILDSISIAVTVLGQPTGAEDELADRESRRALEAEWQREHDEFTHVDVSSDYTEAMWN